MSRTLLSTLLAATTVVGILFFARAMLASMSPDAQARGQREVVLPIETLVPGELRIVKIGDRPIFLLRPTAAQWQAIHRTDAHVWDVGMPAWQPAVDAFVYLGVDTEWGCPLALVPPGQSTLVKFHLSAHDRRPAEWTGGYVSPTCLRTSYDLAGRTLRTDRFTYNGFTQDVPNLTPVPVRRSGQAFVATLSH